MGVAIADLGIQPSEFWKMTKRELYAAYHRRFGKKNPGMSLDRFKELKAKADGKHGARRTSSKT